jgi:hypothetical protein
MSSSDQSDSVSEPARGPFLPQPLPLYDGARIDERHELQGFRRATKLFDKVPQNINAVCAHEEVNDWVCTACNKRVPQFDCILDDIQGRVSQSFKICYENNFLQDFLAEQVNQLAQSDSEEDMDGTPISGGPSSAKKIDRTNPDIIYTQYEPNNATELREYMLFCISRQL